jgi:hypothetical protein
MKIQNLFNIGEDYQQLFFPDGTEIIDVQPTLQEIGLVNMLEITLVSSIIIKYL